MDKREGFEAEIQSAVEILRQRGHDVFVVTNDAVVDVDADADGKKDDNPETGVGAEPGDVVVTVDGRARFVEYDFAGCGDVAEIVAYVEASLAEGRHPL